MVGFTIDIVNKIGPEKRKEKHEPLTHGLPYLGGHQSICKIGRQLFNFFFANA